MRRHATTTSPTDPCAHLAPRRRMLAPSRRGLALSLVFMAAHTTTAHAQESPVPDRGMRGDWILSVGPQMDVYAHTGKGNSTSTEITGPRVVPPNAEFGDLGILISDQERSREDIMSILTGASFGLMTPGLDMPSRPRAFIDVSVSVPQSTETQLARRGNPGRLEFPRGARPPTPVGEGAMNGIGTQITAQHQDPHVHAGIGFSFEYPMAGGQLIRVKPSAVYSRTELDLVGQTIRAVRLNGDAGNAQQLDDFRILQFRDKRTEVYHAAGPALEVEYVPDLAWGSLSLSVFARGHASHIFNDEETAMQQCNTAGGQPNECVRWEYTQDTWTYRASLGVRLNWTAQPLW